MLTKRWLLTTVLCGGIVAAGGMGAGARAANGTLLQPNSDWAISSLAATQAGGQPYCALARRFSNNLIFTIARNAAEESSIAIDFQKQALDNSETYMVTLKPGFGHDRAFNVRPVSGKALVIRLGEDYAFHDALIRSGKLEVDISGETYAFNLPDFSDGQRKLGECLVNLVEPAAGSLPSEVMTPVPPARAQQSAIIPASGSANSAPVSKPAVASPVESYVENNGEVQSLREENVRLRNALERERRSYEDRYLQESQSSSLAAELNEKVRLLEMENKDLRQQLTYVPPAAKPLSCPQPDTSVNESLQKEVNMLRDENIRLKADNQVGATQSDEIATLKEENLRLKQQLDTGASALEQELSMLREENIRLKTGSTVGAALESELSALREENVRLKQQASAASVALDKELETLRNNNLRLKQDIAAQQARNDLLEKQIAENKVPDATDAAVTDVLKERVAKLESENADLKKSNATLSKGGADVPVSLAQLRSIEEQLRYVEQDRDKLLAQIEAVNQGKRDGLLDISSDNWDLEQATRRFNEAEREIQRLARQAEQQRTQCASEKKELEYMLFDPGVAEQQQISKLLELENTVNQAQAVLDEQKANYELKLAELQKQAASTEDEFELQSAEYKQKLAVLEQELASRGDVSEEARNKIAALESKLATTEQEGRAAQTTLEVQRAEYQQKLALLEQQLAERGNVSAATAQNIAALQSQLGDLEKKTKAAEATLEIQKAEYQQKLASLQQQLASRDGASAASQQRVAALEAEIASIAQQKQAAEAALESQRAEYAQKLASLQQEVVAKAEFAEEFRNRIAMLEQEVEQARMTAVQTASAELDAIRRERDELVSQKAGIEQENVQLNGRIAALESQLAEIQTAAGEPVQDPVGDARIAKLMADNEALLEERNRLEQERNALAKAQESLNVKVASLENALADIPTGAGQASARVSAPAPVTAQPLPAGNQADYDVAYSGRLDTQYKDFGSSVQKTVEPAVSGAGSMITASALQGILGRAQISVQGGVEQNDAGAGFVAYSWDTGTLFGSAEQQPMGNASQFEELAESYIKKTSSRCQGDFAALPVSNQESGSIRVSAYEIACIAGSEGASASIVFHADNGKFTAIAHETGLDGMDEAMDVRDRLVSVLMQTQIVAR